MVAVQKDCGMAAGGWVVWLPAVMAVVVGACASSPKVKPLPAEGVLLEYKQLDGAYRLDIDVATAKPFESMMKMHMGMGFSWQPVEDRVAFALDRVGIDMTILGERMRMGMTERGVWLRQNDEPPRMLPGSAEHEGLRIDEGFGKPLLFVTLEAMGPAAPTLNDAMHPALVDGFGKAAEGSLVAFPTLPARVVYQGETWTDEQRLWVGRSDVALLMIDVTYRVDGVMACGDDTCVRVTFDGSRPWGEVTMQSGRTVTARYAMKGVAMIAPAAGRVMSSSFTIDTVMKMPGAGELTMVGTYRLERQ